MKKRIFSLIVTAAIIVSQFVFVSEFFPVASAETISGVCGDNITWTLDSDTKILYVDGYGKMDDFNIAGHPWEEYDYFIDEIIFSEGITQIAKYSFYRIYVNKITFPSTLDLIASSAFAFLGNVSDIVIPENTKLREFEDFSSSSVTKSTWYKNLPDGPVYFGNLLCGYKGVMPENYCLDVEKETYAINIKAFINQLNLVEINIPDSVIHMGLDALKNTGWYNTQPDGAIYAGKIFYEFRGEPQINDKTFTVADGTVSVAPNAFKFKNYITDIFLPSSIKTIGESAFYQMGAMETVNFAEGCELEFIGKKAFAYSQQLQNFNFVGINSFFPESVLYVGDEAFRLSYRIKEIINIPAGLRDFGNRVFTAGAVIGYDVDEKNKFYSDDEYNILYNKDKTVLIAAPVAFEIKEIILPETVKEICSYAFNKAGVYKVTLPDGIIDLGENTFKDSVIKEINLPYGITTLREFVFASCHIKELVLPTSVTTIENNACQWSQLQKIIIPKETVNIVGNPFKKTNSSSPTLTIYCYENSAAHNTAVEYGINYVLLDAVMLNDIKETIEKAEKTDRSLYTYESLEILDKAVNAAEIERPDISQSQVDEWENAIIIALESLEYKPADYTSVDDAIKKAEEIDRKLYTEASLAELDAVLNSVDRTLNITNQSVVYEFTDRINIAIDNLKYKSADYYAVDSAVKRAQSIERSLYTIDSLSKLDVAVESVVFDADITQQDVVTGYAIAINNALDNLEYLPADYTEVYNEIAKTKDIDRILYSQVTLAVLDQRIDSVDYSLDITKQNTVDEYADAIRSAVDMLKYADVILRDDMCGVVVSATAKEIYPTTSLTVDILDPSNYETANFAVGGYIKSVQYYDINLIRNSAKVQPDGTVYVKIKIPEGVKPEKCRVYHVTEDPVDPLVRFSSALDGNYIVFETDHFSEFAVIEVETVLSGISVTKEPAKLNYTLNEKIDLSGLEITAVMSDGTLKTVKDYVVSAVDTTSVGVKTVMVYYTLGDITKSTSYEIVVSSESISADITVNGENVNQYNKKVKWYKGYSSETLQLECDIPENCSVIWQSDNEKVNVDSNGKVTNKGFFIPRKAVITVTVKDSNGNTVATDNIVLRFYKFSFQLSGIQNIFTSFRNSFIFLF